MSRTLCALCLTLLIHAIHAIHPRTHTHINNYLHERLTIIEAEQNRTVGGKITFNADEARANNIIMQLKMKELERGFQNSSQHQTAKHFFRYKQTIERSKLLQIIRKMPKGAALHLHVSMAMSPEYMVNLTYTDNLYICYAHGKMHDMIFSNTIPQRPCPLNWQLMSDLRYDSGDIERFDKELEKLFTIHSDDEKIEHDINRVWGRFNDVNRAIGLLLAYRPVRERHFYDVLQSFYDDKVLYVEVRSSLKQLYELDGRRHESIELARLYKRVAKRFADAHEDFVGVKYIMTAFRGSDIKKVSEALNLARQVKAELPDLFAGFDLVGQEDKGRPLVDFLPALIEAQNDIDYYFHGGETNWYGMTSDDNLVDAILLGTKRIGHAYSLAKHPTLLEVVKNRNIAIEVNVISNNVLALVEDVRNHPLAIFLAQGMPVVLSSDDPGVWGADPMSHDFYVAFQCIASGRADLRTLKQLALNSIRYSALGPKGKAKAFKIFHRQWREFISVVLSSY